MSDFMEMFVEMLPQNSALRKKDNDLYTVLDKSLGEYMDNSEFDFDNLFLTTAKGKWLDVHGRDYGVPRKLDESDDDYRQRIVFEKLEYLTARNLIDIYGLTLYAYVNRFNTNSNSLTSDNPYTSNKYMAFDENDLKEILSRKFVLDDGIVWISDKGFSEFIIDVDGNDILDEYTDIYSLNDLRGYFSENLDLKELKLDLPIADNCRAMFGGCTSLISVDLNLPSAIMCYYMFQGCTSLKDVKLNIRNVSVYLGMFLYCPNIETIDVTIPDSQVDNFKDYVLYLNLQHLSKFIINGEEVDL